MSEKIKTLYEDKGQTEVLYPRTVFEAVGNGIETLEEILEEIDSNKQDNLQSGKNIKTIEGQSLVGSGNIDITASNVGLENVVNTGDSATPVENGTTKFTTGGAYTMQTTLQSGIDSKASLASPAFTGTPTAPTPSTSSNNTQIATTAFVKSQPTILYGTSVPSSTLGKNGDIYILYS